MGGLELLEARRVPLAHLAWHEAAALSEAELDAIADYTRRGGRVLIESLGGQGGFAAGMERQLRSRYPSPPAVLSSASPILSGLTHVTYRLSTTRTQGPRNTAGFTAYFVDGRAAVILSEDDLTHALMHLPRRSTLGYSPASATALMRNLLKAITDDAPSSSH